MLFQQHAAPVLCRPTKDSLASFATLCEELGPPAALHARVLELLAAPSASSEDISALTPAIREWTSALHDVAVRACGVYVPSTEHHRHRTRRMKRVHLSHVRTAAFMQSAITLSHRQPPGWRTDVCFAQLSREHPDLALPSLLDDADDPSELALFTTSDYTDRAHVAERLRSERAVTDWRTRVDAARIRETQAANAVNAQQRQQQHRAEARRLRAELNKRTNGNLKVAPKARRIIERILNPEQRDLRAVRGASNNVIVEPAAVVTEVARQYAEVMQPTPLTDSSDTPPWAQPGAMDGFTPRKAVGVPPLSTMLTYDRYLQCLKQLSSCSPTASRRRWCTALTSC